MFHRIVPLMNAQQKALYKYSKNKPVLNWDLNNEKGVFNSGWNPFKGVNVCFHDESDTQERMSIIIEINMPILKRGISVTSIPHIPYICNDIQDDIIAYGYFFEKDSHSKKINMTLRIKPFRNRERKIIYQDCQYFGLDYNEIFEGNIFNNQHILQSYFTISNEFQDRALCTGVNFLHKHFRDFEYIVDIVNDFIQANKIREQFVPEIVSAYPLLKHVYKIPSARDILTLHLYENIRIGYPNPMAVARIEDMDDDDCDTVIYTSNVVVL